MCEHRYILLIDTSPPSEELMNYFSQLELKIIQTPVFLTPDTTTSLHGIVIDWALLKNEPQLINKFYNQYSVPLIITSDNKDEELCIQVLNQGADDFMVKPLYPRELHARINAIGRRITGPQLTKAVSKRDILSFANWRVYSHSRQVFKNDCEVQLSAGEYDLLMIFISKPQKILARELLLQGTKNNDLNPLDRRIDVQISRLRQKIEKDAKNPTFIKTIRNSGYIFTAPVEAIRETT